MPDLKISDLPNVALPNANFVLPIEDPSVLTSKVTIANLATAIGSQLPLGSLSNVTIAGASQDDVLIFDGVGWNTGTPNMALNQLNDVSVAGAVAGDFLNFDGTEWVGSEISFNTLTDVNIVGATATDVLQFNGTNWYNAPLSAATAANLNSLSDVTLASPAVGELLFYDGTEWVNTYVDSGILLDFNISSPTVGQLLFYNGTEWVNTFVNSNILTDFNISSPTVGQVLTYSASGFWQNATLPTPSLNLNALTDVAITSPTANQVLSYNGTTWLNTAAPSGGATNLDALTDVVISSPANTQVLTYNGTNWVNSAAPSGGSGLNTTSILPLGFTNNLATSQSDLVHNAAGLVQINGMIASASNQTVTFHNLGPDFTSVIFIPNENAAASATNRFRIPNNGTGGVYICRDQSITFRYVATINRWVPVDIGGVRDYQLRQVTTPIYANNINNYVTSVSYSANTSYWLRFRLAYPIRAFFMDYVITGAASGFAASIYQDAREQTASNANLNVTLGPAVWRSGAQVSLNKNSVTSAQHYIPPGEYILEFGAPTAFSLVGFSGSSNTPYPVDIEAPTSALYATIAGFSAAGTTGRATIPTTSAPTNLPLIYIY